MNTALVLFFISLPSVAQEKSMFEYGKPVFERIGDFQIFQSTSSRQVIKGPRGFYWLNVGGELYRYDGYKFKHYPLPRSDEQSVNLSRIFFDRKNRMFLATSSYMLVLDSADPSNFANAREVRERVNRIQQDSLGNIWLATRKGIIRLSEDFAEKESFVKGIGAFKDLESNFIRHLAIDAQDRLWLVSDMSLYMYEKGMSIRKILNSDRHIHAVYPDLDGNIWVSSVSERFKVSPSLTIEKLPIEYDIRRFLEVGDDQMWLATRWDGILVIDKRSYRTLKHYTHDPANKYSLPSNSITGLYKDNTGLIWINSNTAGTSRFNTNNDYVRNLLHSPLDAESLVGGEVIASKELTSGDVLINSYSVGLDVFSTDPQNNRVFLPEGRSGEYQVKENTEYTLPDAKIWEIVEMPDGKVWLATNTKGVFRFEVDKRRFVPLNSDFPLLNGAMRHLYQYSENSLIASPMGHLVEIDNDTYELSFFNILDKDTDGTLPMEFIHRDVEGNHWIADTRNKLYLIPDKSRNAYPVTLISNDQQAISLTDITGLGALKNQHWYLTDKSGLWINNGYHIENEQVVASFELLVSNDANHLKGYQFEDKFGRLWGGKSIVDIEKRTVRLLSLADGIGVDRIYRHAHEKLSDGTLMFGGSNGVILIKPELFQEWQCKPEIVISDWYLDGELQAYYPSSLSLPSGRHSVSFEFASLDTTMPEANQYRYRLQGYNDAWTHVGAARRQATYTDLPAGNYRLEIQGTNRIGVWSDKSVSIPVSVIAPWYKAWWFLYFIGLCSFICLIILVRYFFLRLQGKLSALDNKVHQQELELQNYSAVLAVEKVQTEQLQAEIKTLNERRVVSDKYASLGRVIAKVAEHFQTPLTQGHAKLAELATELKNVDYMLDKTKLNEVQAFVKNKKIKSTIEGINSQFETSFDLVKRVALISSQQVEQAERDVNFASMIQSIISSYEYEHPKTRGLIKLSCDSSIQLRANTEVYLRIFCNLLMHAFDVSYRGELSNAKVEIDVAQTSQERVDYINISFTDFGHGMEQQALQAQLQPVDANLGKAFSEVNLNLVFSLVTHQLNGRITCSSSVGGNTAFTLVIPVEKSL